VRTAEGHQLAITARRESGLRVPKMLTFIAMALLFFVVVTPLAVILRVAGRDRLQLRRQPEKASYWVIRQSSGVRPNAMIGAA
jgi:hypothetical protein